MAIYDHVAECYAGFLDPRQRVYEAAVSHALGIHGEAYARFQEESGFIMYRVASDLRRSIRRLKELSTCSVLKQDLEELAFERYGGRLLGKTESSNAN